MHLDLHAPNRHQSSVICTVYLGSRAVKRHRDIAVYTVHLNPGYVLQQLASFQGSAFEAAQPPKKRHEYENSAVYTTQLKPPAQSRHWGTGAVWEVHLEPRPPPKELTPTAD